MDIGFRQMHLEAITDDVFKYCGHRVTWCVTSTIIFQVLWPSSHLMCQIYNHISSTVAVESPGVLDLQSYKAIES
jgi:hypothetical protein